MLTLPVYDLIDKCFIDNYFVDYRNTLLEKLFPGIEFAIGTVASAMSWKPEKISQILDKGFLDYNIVGATGARKKGHVLYAKAPNTLFVDYFGSYMNAVNYGSNLTTECKVIEKLKPTIMVVEDGELKTGDCHGKVSPAFASKFGFQKNSCQFRLACEQPKWVAKGTLVSSANLPEQIDIVLPVSCFKGNKVKPGIYNDEVWFGIKNVFDVGSVSLSFSVVQFLSWETIQKDLLPQTLEHAKELSQIYTDSVTQKAFMLTNMKDESITQAVINDDYDQLLKHPYTQSKLGTALSKEWRSIATGTAVEFNLSTCVPDDRLGHHECYIPGVEDGKEIIVFPYPCRWKYDIKVWKNRVMASWHQQDVIVVNHETALELGRDFDGDRLPWALAEDYPNIAAEVKGFGEPPIQGLKPEKRKLDLSLGQTTVLSMDGKIGLITWTIAKANCLGREDIINLLVPQLQLAVDCLKGSEPPNEKLIKQCLKQLEGDIPWLNQYKSSVRYNKEAIESGNCTDSISNLNREVSKLWIPPANRVIGKRAYSKIYNVSTFDLAYARSYIEKFTADYDSICSRYIGDLSEKQQIDRDYQIKCLFDQHKKHFDSMEFPDRFDKFKAFWECQHSTPNGTASLCMYLFADIVAVEFAELKFRSFKTTKKYNCDFSKVKAGIYLCNILHENDSYILVNQAKQRLGSLLLQDNPFVNGRVPVRIEDRGSYLFCQIIL